jgi:hypothetical protein
MQAGFAIGSPKTSPWFHDDDGTSGEATKLGLWIFASKIRIFNCPRTTKEYH